MSPWVPRDSAAEYAFAGRIWIAGGWVDSFAPVLRDVWSSADGASWRLDVGEAPWTHADLAASAVHDGRMWMLGGWTDGRLPGANATNEVWSSTDGTAWELNALPGWEPRVGAAAASFGGRLWLSGGVRQYYFGDDSDLRNDVWSTPDGLAWTRARERAPWAPRAYHQMVAHDGRLYVLGGGNYLPAYQAYNDVWSSVDGVEWRLETAAAPWPPRIWFSAVSYRGYLLVLGGWSNNPYQNWDDVWYSRDGRNWTRYEAGPQWLPRHEHSTVVHDDQIWVAGGLVAGALTSEVWRLRLPGDWLGSCAAH